MLKMETRLNRRQPRTKKTKVPPPEDDVPQVLPPLENPAILSVLFDQCPVPTLKNARLVCKQWRDISMKRWRRNAVLCISVPDLASSKEGSDDHDDYEQREEKKLIKISEFKQFCENRDNPYALFLKPFKSYKLEEFVSGSSDLSRDDDIPGKPELIWFFQTFGAHIMHLDLSEVSFSLDTRLLSLIYSHAPNIETLKLRVDTIYGWIFPTPWVFGRPLLNLKALWIEELTNNFEENHEFPWASFFRTMPNMQKFTVSFLSALSDEENEECFKLLKHIAEAATGWRKLKDLDILVRKDVSHWMDEFPKDIANIIKEAAFPLERLSVDLGCKCTPSVIKIFLEPHKQSLEYLRIFRGERKVSERTKLPVIWSTPLPMENLKEVSFKDSLSNGFHLLSGLQLPVLEKLVFDEVLDMYEAPKQAEGRCCNFGPPPAYIEKNKRYVNSFHMQQRLTRIIGGLSYPLVHTFEFHEMCCILRAQEIEALGKAMPNVKHLKMRLTANTLPIVCQVWSELRSLEIIRGDGRDVDDVAITGIQKNVRRFARPANITNLEKLNRLIISNKMIFSEHAALHGFLRMPELSYLRVNITPLSKKVKTLLEEKIMDLEILRLEACDDDCEHDGIDHWGPPPGCIVM